MRRRRKEGGGERLRVKEERAEKGAMWMKEEGENSVESSCPPQPSTNTGHRPLSYKYIFVYLLSRSLRLLLKLHFNITRKRHCLLIK